MGVTGIGQGNYQAYYDTLRAYREQQFSKGDMVGYQETTQTCEEWNRTAGKQKDISEYLDMPQGKVNIQQKEGNLQSGILGLSVIGNEKPEVPYNHLAKDGFIDYNGVVFVCDEEHNAICLGNVTDKENCLTIPLSEGGCLIVNRDNLGDLAKAISMFSPEDVNRIMRAIAQDAKVQQMKKELDDEEDTIGMAESTQEENGAVQMVEKESDENKIDEK